MCLSWRVESNQLLISSPAEAGRSEINASALYLAKFAEFCVCCFGSVPLYPLRIENSVPYVEDVFAKDYNV